MRRQMLMLRKMNCPSCAGKLEKATRALPGMVAVSVSFGSGALHVQYDEAQVSEEQIRRVVRQLGLEVATVLNRTGGDSQ